jgi:hypothetical protein
MCGRTVILVVGPLDSDKVLGSGLVQVCHIFTLAQYAGCACFVISHPPPTHRLFDFRSSIQLRSAVVVHPDCSPPFVKSSKVRFLVPQASPKSHRRSLQ